MSREDIARLLGGYATGTLTPEEQQALFAAALEDQTLFDELAREQALRDVLREPAARGQLLAALEERPRWYRRLGPWMMRPAALTAAAACLVLGAMAIWRPWRGNEAAKPAVIATALPREAPPIPSPSAVAEQKTPALSAERARARAMTPPASRAVPAAKKQLLVAQETAPAAEAHRADEPVAASGAAMPPAASPAPPPPKAASQPIVADTSIAGRDASELTKIMPGVGGAPGSGNAAVRGALSADRLQTAVATAPGGDARQRYYAAMAFAEVKAQAETQSVRARAQAQAPGSQPPLGIKWGILRREANGEFAIVNAEDLRAGDTVELRLTSNQSCGLSVFDNASGKLLPLFTKQVEAGETVDTPLLTPGEKGSRELVVELWRGGNVAGFIVSGRPAVSREAQQSQTDRSEQATYTVGPPGAQRVLLSVTLNYQ